MKMKLKLSLILLTMCACVVGCSNGNGSKEKIIYVDQNGNTINKTSNDCYNNLSASSDGSVLMYMTKDKQDFLNYVASLDMEKYDIITCGPTEYGLQITSTIKYFIVYKIKK